MLRRGQMKASDFTCMMCGSKLGIKFTDIKVGDNLGSCPMCSEPYRINVTGDEMEQLMEAEEQVNLI